MARRAGGKVERPASPRIPEVGVWCSRVIWSTGTRAFGLLPSGEAGETLPPSIGPYPGRPLAWRGRRFSGVRQAVHPARTLPNSKKLVKAVSAR